MTYSFDSYVTVEVNGEEVECPVTITFSASYTPAKTYGPPEDCYPEDSEMEFDKVETDEAWNTSYGVTPEAFNAALEDSRDRLEQEAYSQGNEEADYYNELEQGYAQDRI